MVSCAGLTASVSASQGIVVGVGEIYILGISSAAVNLTLLSPTAGNDFSPATDSSSSYSVTVNSSQTRKIAASISSVLPSGMNLSMTLQAPTGGTSQGPVLLTAAAKDAVLGVTDVAQSNLNITYSLTCAIGQSTVGSGSRVVTLTLVNQ